MSEEQLIPNAVGRLDDVVAAIRRGDIDKACTLLETDVEHVRETILSTCTVTSDVQPYQKILTQDG